MEDNQTNQFITSKHATANREAGSLQIRLETASIKEKISTFLKGKVVSYNVDMETKKIRAVTQEIGKPKVNDRGYQDIMSFLECVVNHSTVMGNFNDESSLYNYLHRTFKDYIKHLWINMNHFGINPDEFGGIRTMLMSLIEAFMTRTIGDGERATIRETTIQRDSLVTDQRKTSFSPLKFFK